MTQRIAVIGTGFRPQGHNLPPIEIANITGSGFEAELIEIQDGVFPGDPKARAVCDAQYYQAGLQAQASGFDAVYINTMGDYGLIELRNSLQIPVVGSGDTSLRLAAAYGQFSIVTIWPPSLDFIYERVLAQTDTAGELIGITHMAANDDLASLADETNFVTRMRSCGLSAMQDLTDARNASIEQDGATAVVLGCTCMAPTAAFLVEHPGAVTLDPMTLGYQFAEYCLGQGQRPQDVDFRLAKQDWNFRFPTSGAVKGQ